MSWTVPLANFAYPILKENRCPCRSCSHIAEHKRVIGGRILWLKFSHQFLCQPANVRLVNCARMVGYEPRESPTRPGVPDPARAIQRMKSSNRQRRRIADVVQIRRRYKQIPILGGDNGDNLARLLSYLRDVTPAVPERRQQPLSVGRSPRRQGHAVTLQEPQRSIL